MSAAMSFKMQAAAARPYAKALLAFCFDQQENFLPEVATQWEKFLSLLDVFFSVQKIQKYYASPIVTKQKKIENLFHAISAISPLTMQEKAFLTILSDARRLLVLPSIYTQFSRLLDLHLDRKLVEISTAQPLSQEEKTQIIEKLRCMYHVENIILNETLDRSLLAGFIIRTGDKVLDLSLLGRWESLYTRLMTS